MSLKHRNVPKTAFYKKLKAVLIGCGLGGALLLSFVLPTGQHSSNVAVAPLPRTPTGKTPANKRSVKSASKPFPDIVLSKIPASETDSSPAPEVPIASGGCGEQSVSGDIMSPAFKDHAGGEQSKQQNCGSEIAKTSNAGTPASQAGSFADRQRAKAFARKVGSKVSQPYRLPPLPSTARTRSAFPSSSALPSPSESEIDATISGNQYDSNTGSSSDTPYRLAPFVFASPAPSLSSAPAPSPAPSDSKLSDPKSP
jgi:hypothetical protein